MIKLHGVAVTGGIAVGKICTRWLDMPVVEERMVSPKQAQAEWQRYREASEFLVKDIDQLIKSYSYSRDDREILATHKLIIKDPELEKSIRNLVMVEHYGLEYAIHRHFSELIDLFKGMDNELFAQRAMDYRDVAERFLRFLTGRIDSLAEGLDESSVLLMPDINPSSVPMIVARGVRGLVLEHGGYTSHASIMARSFNLVAVVGVHELMNHASQGDTIIINGWMGEIVLNPDDETLAFYLDLIVKEELEQQELLAYATKPAATYDHQPVEMAVNIELPSEIEALKSHNLAGIGLFRTEFIYLTHPELPDEEEQYQVYSRVAAQMGGKKVVIRTIDIGGDKISKILNIAKENNPNLGLRGVRLSLRHPTLFIQQLRAVLRAAVHGNLALMFPMISGPDDLNQARAVLNTCIAQLREEGVEHNPNLPVGIMIEVPSACLLADQLSADCDFFSIGTNDLIQYTLAVDRDSENVLEYYNPTHPAVWHLIKMTVDAAARRGIPVSVCGEMASSPDLLPALVGLGINSVSVSPAMVLKLKRVLAQISRGQATELAETLLMASSCEEVASIIKGGAIAHPV